MARPGWSTWGPRRSPSDSPEPRPSCGCHPRRRRRLRRATRGRATSIGTARLAGIQAAKRTPELIPLAHSLALTFVGVEVRIDETAGLVVLTSEARTVGQTGVEMEAMTACAAAALTVYDMVKGIERGVSIERISLLEKSGGRSGEWQPASWGQRRGPRRVLSGAGRNPHDLDVAGGGGRSRRERRCAGGLRVRTWDRGRRARGAPGRSRADRRRAWSTGPTRTRAIWCSPREGRVSAPTT